MKLLADSASGHTEAILLVHGIPLPVLVELVHAGLATATVERLSWPKIEIALVEITDAGRKALSARPMCQ